MNPQTEYWWLQHLLTFIGIILGALIVIWQMGKQHRNALLLQKNNLKDQMKLEIYREFASKLQTVADAINDTSSQIATIPMQFIPKITIQEFAGTPPEPIDCRFQDLIDLHHHADKLWISLIFLMERYEIALPKFREFIEAFGEQSDRYRKAFSPYFDKIIQFLPKEISLKEKEKEIDKTITPAYPTEVELKELESLSDQYQDVCVQSLCYIEDLRIALQNELLSSLFNRRLALRQPTDSKFRVLGKEKQE